MAVLAAYVDLFEFQTLELDRALRDFLGSFRLPGEVGESWGEERDKSNLVFVLCFGLGSKDRADFRSIRKALSRIKSRHLCSRRYTLYSLLLHRHVEHGHSQRGKQAQEHVQGVAKEDRGEAVLPLKPNRVITGKGEI